MTHFDKLKEDAKALVEYVGEQLGPEEDWSPMLLLETNEKVVIAGFDGKFFENDASKDKMCSAITKLIKQTRATAVVYICSAWIRTIPPEAIHHSEEPFGKEHLKDGKSMNDFPIESEIVTLVACDLDHTEGLSAEIVRSDNEPPKLKAWEETQINGGRFSDALVNGIASIHEDDDQQLQF